MRRPLSTLQLLPFLTIPDARRSPGNYLYIYDGESRCSSSSSSKVDGWVILEHCDSFDPENMKKRRTRDVEILNLSYCYIFINFFAIIRDLSLLILLTSIRINSHRVLKYEYWSAARKYIRTAVVSIDRFVLQFSWYNLGKILCCLNQTMSKTLAKIDFILSINFLQFLQNRRISFIIV